MGQKILPDVSLQFVVLQKIPFVTVSCDRWRLGLEVQRRPRAENPRENPPLSPLHLYLRLLLRVRRPTPNFLYFQS